MLTRPCALNDTVCGQWKDRYWHPISCRYEDISSEQARKCLGNRTLAFIGDSQIRDTGVGVASFLLGQELHDAPDYKFDRKGRLDADGQRLLVVANVLGGRSYDGYHIPKPDVASQHGYEWQVQFWSLFDVNLFHEHATEILNNEVTAAFPTLLKPIDLAFLQIGLHNLWWNKPPYGPNYYKEILTYWLRFRGNVTVPNVWLSMNNECKASLQKASDIQGDMVEDANKYMNEQMMKEQLPYWDAAAVLRSSQRCNVSDDGVHVKMYVDIMRAKMLFNHLCDSDMNWRGSAELFV